MKLIRRVFLVRLSHWNRLKMEKNSKNYKQFAKTQIIEDNKKISYNPNIRYFSVFIHTNSAKARLKD